MDDCLETFMLERTGFRGRVVRLGGILDSILDPHRYPESLGHATAQVTALATLLASMLKYEGVFTLQVQGDGPVAAIVADMTSAGLLRACATVRDGRAGDIPHSRTTALDALVGKGYLAFTVDQGGDAERYQGIVELKPGGLLDSVNAYFRQSEQILTGVKLAVSHLDGHWRAGGILVQHVPDEGGLGLATESGQGDDGWRRTMILLESCTDAELTDADLSADDVLFRLFHEEGARVFAPMPLTKGCRCSRDRLLAILMGMTMDDRQAMIEGGVITMTCQFCSNAYVFRPDEVGL